VNVFVVKDFTSEEFFKRVLTSDIDIDERLDNISHNKEQLSSLTTKSLKDLLQITYGKTKTGLIPVLHVIENPEHKANEEDGKDSEDNKDNKNGSSAVMTIAQDKTVEQESEKDKSYTFSYYGLGIVKDGNLKDYLPLELVRSYLILTKSVKSTTIEIEISGKLGESEQSEQEENGNKNFFVFHIDSSQNKTSFEFDKNNNVSKVIFNVSIDTSYAETDLEQDSRQLEILDAMQSEIIKDEIERIIAKSKEVGADFLGIGETLGTQHPYKWNTLENDWENIFENLNYEVNVTTKTKRYYNLQ
jgi:hypothetical protein